MLEQGWTNYGREGMVQATSSVALNVANNVTHIMHFRFKYSFKNIMMTYFLPIKSNNIIIIIVKTAIFEL
jgi:hypothetical protein